LRGIKAGEYPAIDATLSEKLCLFAPIAVVMEKDIFCVRVRLNVHKTDGDREYAAIAKWALARGQLRRPAEPVALCFRKIAVYRDGVPVLKKIPGKGLFMPTVKNLEKLCAAMRAADDVATLCRGVRLRSCPMMA